MVLPLFVWRLPRLENDASLQSRIPLDLTRYLSLHWRAFGAWLVGALLLVSMIVLTAGGWRVGGLVGLVLWGAGGYFLLRMMACCAWLGDVCPAVALTTELGVAYSDLRLRAGDFPVLKVFRLIKKTPAGTRMGTACWYYVSDQTSPCWSDLLPNALEEFTSDGDLVLRTTAQIPASDWSALEAGVELVRPTEEGLYALPAGNWPEAWHGRLVTSKMIEKRYLGRGSGS